MAEQIRVRPRGAGWSGDGGSGEHDGMLSIGALARATDVSIETLRTWERRYGFPTPERKPSGHRLYPLAHVERLRRIAEALARGHRAGDVVRASDGALQSLLAVAPLASAPRLSVPHGAPADLLDVVRRFDGAALLAALNAVWARMSPMPFLTDFVAPLVRLVGDEWAAGRLSIRHEHFVSERLVDVLRTNRIPFEEGARGPLVVFATLPGEVHALGLQMAALVVAMAGCRVCYVGTEVPVDEIATLGRDLGARAVAVSMSVASKGARSGAMLARLSRSLPRRTTLVVGGEGAPARLAGGSVMKHFADLEAWARQLATAGH